MRSVVVVLPASMWAMMPMLRTLLRSVSTSCATGCPPKSCWGEDGADAATRVAASACRLPAVVGECLVRLGHLVSVLTTLHSGAEAVGRVEDLVGEALGHGLLAASLGVAGEPAQRQGVRAVRLDLDRNLVGGATDATRPDLEGRAHVVECLLQGDDGVLAILGRDTLECVVHDALGDGLLAILEDLVDELADDRCAVDGVCDDGALGRGSFTRHYFLSIFAP